MNNTLEGFDEKSLAKLPARIRKLFDCKLDEDGWPLELAMPRAVDFIHGRWVEPVCKTKGCLVGWVGWAFHRNPTIHLGQSLRITGSGHIAEAYDIDGDDAICWTDGCEFSVAAETFMRDLLVELGCPAEVTERLHDAHLWNAASDWFERGAIMEYVDGAFIRTAREHDREVLGACTGKEVAAAWRRAAEKRGYDVR